jgi:hypothetical protein
MKAELRRLHSPDVHDLTDWVPEQRDFAILVQAMVGPVGAIGEESFDIMVTTLSPLADRVHAEGVVNGLHTLIVDEYDFDALRLYIEKFVSSLEGGTWHDLATELSLLGRWEFDRYR